MLKINGQSLLLPLTFYPKKSSIKSMISRITLKVQRRPKKYCTCSVSMIFCHFIAVDEKWLLQMEVFPISRPNNTITPRRRVTEPGGIISSWYNNLLTLISIYISGKKITASEMHSKEVWESVFLNFDWWMFLLLVFTLAQCAKLQRVIIPFIE